jgi:DNA-binding response OmpR family regulator
MNYTLLADDDEDFGTLLQVAFEIAGIGGGLRRVRDGASTLGYLRGEGRYVNRYAFPFPSLVLLDLNLPRPNGWEVLRWIRTRSPFARLHVVILTGMEIGSEMHRALEMGADDCWEKPFPFTGLVSMVEHFRDRWLMEEQPLLRAA